MKLLHDDLDVLNYLNEDWDKEDTDPKFDKFKAVLALELMSPAINQGGKLVIFSESVDTLNYLYKRMTNELGLDDVMLVTSENRNKVGKTIKENFDANSREKKINITLF